MCEIAAIHTHSRRLVATDWLTPRNRFGFNLVVLARISRSHSLVSTEGRTNTSHLHNAYGEAKHTKKTQTRHETRLRMPSPNRRRKTHSRNQITWHDMCFKIMLMSEAVAFLCRSVHIASSAGLKNHPQHCADVASVCLPTRVCERVLSTHHNRFERQLKREIFMRRHTSRRRCESARLIFFD